MQKKHLIFIGFKSSGKSYWGQLLSKIFNFDFIDTDLEIEKKYLHTYGQSCNYRQIAKLLGEDEFREIEQTVVANLKMLTSPTIIATGGGTLLRDDNIHTLKQLGSFVYLKTTPAIIKQRLAHLDPPYMNTKSDTNFEKLFLMREKIYEKMTEFTIEIKEEKDDQILQKFLNTLSHLTYSTTN